jgi:hypothetical protein
VPAARYPDRHIVDLRRVPDDLAVGQQHGRHVAPFIADDRDGVAEPEVLRSHGRQDIVEGVGHGDRGLDTVIERIAAAVAAGREGNDRVEINLRDR